MKEALAQLGVAGFVFSSFPSFYFPLRQGFNGSSLLSSRVQKSLPPSASKHVRKHCSLLKQGGSSLQFTDFTLFGVHLFFIISGSGGVGAVDKLYNQSRLTSLYSRPYLIP